MNDPTQAVVSLAWDALTEDEKRRTHLAVNFPGSSLENIEGARHLGTEPGGVPHSAVVEAVNNCAAKWHKEAGRT